MKIELSALFVLTIALGGELLTNNQALAASGTAYPCNVQMIPAGRSKVKGLGMSGAVRVEFWGAPECGGGYCGVGYFMTEDASHLPTGTLQSYSMNQSALLAQYEVVAAAASAGKRVSWNTESALFYPLIYELKVVTGDGAAFCSAPPDKGLPVLSKP